MEVSFSRGSLKESANKAVTDVKQLAEFVPMLQGAVKTAVGIESHNNRYFADNQVVRFHELIGGYIENEIFVPVRLGVKEFKDGRCNLYVVVSQEKIETEVKRPKHMDKSSGDLGHPSVNVSIAQIASDVKLYHHRLYRQG